MKDSGLEKEGHRDTIFVSIDKKTCEVVIESNNPCEFCKDYNVTCDGKSLACFVPCG